VNKTAVNHAASVHRRLLNLAKVRGRLFNELLQYYAIERFLFPLAQSQNRDRLKAAQHPGPCDTRHGFDVCRARSSRR
jgi:hypothetical protein